MVVVTFRRMDLPSITFDVPAPTTFGELKLRVQVRLQCACGAGMPAKFGHECRGDGVVFGLSAVLGGAPHPQGEHQVRVCWPPT